MNRAPDSAAIFGLPCEVRSTGVEDVRVGGIKRQRDNWIRPLSAEQRDAGPIAAAVTREIDPFFGAGRDHMTIDLPRCQSPHLFLRQSGNRRPGGALIDTAIHTSE